MIIKCLIALAVIVAVIVKDCLQLKRERSFREVQTMPSWQQLLAGQKDLHFSCNMIRPDLLCKKAPSGVFFAGWRWKVESSVQEFRAVTEDQHGKSGSGVNEPSFRSVYTSTCCSGGAAQRQTTKCSFRRLLPSGNRYNGTNATQHAADKTAGVHSQSSCMV